MVTAGNYPPNSSTVDAAAEQAFDKVHPAFARELEQLPNDPHGAWDRALAETKASGAFDAPGWSLFPTRFFSEHVKSLAFEKMEKDWIENPAFWSLFVRMIANAADAGGPAESAKVVRSMCDQSGIPPERVVAKLKTHLFLNTPTVQ